MDLASLFGPEPLLIVPSEMLYFDHNATSPMLPEAKEAWLEAVAAFPGNPSSPHRLGARADAALNSARERLAALLGCHPLDIIFTSGATESNNMGMRHYAQTLPTGAEVWISALEHPSVLESARHDFGSRIQWIPSLPSGVVDCEWILKRLKKASPGFIALMAVNNETGVIQPWDRVALLASERQIPFFCDATQWIGKLPAKDLQNCSWISGSAHKFGGPRGCGFLKCPAKGRLAPLLLGGPQEESRRAGTENVAAVLSMMRALEIREASLAKPSALQTKELWRQDFEADLRRALPGVRIVGETERRLWNTVCALMPNADCRKRWVVKLDRLGFAVSTGSACASGKETASHVLRAMGIAEDAAGRALRFSSGWETSQSDWASLLQAIRAAARA